MSIWNIDHKGDTTSSINEITEGSDDRISTSSINTPSIDESITSEEDPKRILEELLENPRNAICADCNAPNPTWASVNNGVFICTQCAGVHRSLGVQISFVLSCKLDDWTLEQVYNVASVDNIDINNQLEFSVPDAYRKPDGEETSRDIREHYIKAKYKERLFEVGPNRRRQPPITARSGSSVSSIPNHGMVEYIGILTLQLIEGKDLIGMDINGLSDPYVVFRLGGQAVTSSTVKHSLNPKWNETLMLSWDGQASIQLEVYDFRTIGPDRPMGSIIIPSKKINSLINEKKEIELCETLMTKKIWAQNFGDHMVAGAEDVGKGFYNGITGVWKDPINGAKKSGIGGLAKGLGRGIAGVIYRPIKGFGKLVRETARGFRGKKYHDQIEMIPAGTISINVSLQPIGH